MTCEHCKARVESRLNELDGVSAKVNLKRKTAVVSMEKEVEDEEIKKTKKQEIICFKVPEKNLQRKAI